MTYWIKTTAIPPWVLLSGEVCGVQGTSYEEDHRVLESSAALLRLIRVSDQSPKAAECPGVSGLVGYISGLQT